MYLSVIIPAYNEEKCLAENIKKFNNYLGRQNYDYEIIIVNDGSIDRTKEIAEKFALGNNKIKLISHKKNQGKGAAVKTGFIEAKGEYFLFIDADGATSIDHIDLIWPEFNNGYDIVIGSRSQRDIKGAKQELPQAAWKRFLGICGNYLIRFLTIRDIYDTQCGFKAFTKQATEKITEKMTISRWGFDVEMLAVAKLLNYKIAKIPACWINNPDSRVGIKGYFTSLKDIIKIKYNIIAKKYY